MDSSPFLVLSNIPGVHQLLDGICRFGRLSKPPKPIKKGGFTASSRCSVFI